MSVPQMPTAVGSIRTSPSPGAGSGRSTSSSCSPPWNSIARMRPVAGSDLAAGGDVDHLPRAHELDPRTAQGLAQAGLVGVDRPPPLPGHEVRALLRQEGPAAGGVGVLGGVELA